MKPGIFNNDCNQMSVTLVHPYNSAWPSHFQEIEKYLEPCLTDIDCRIEHVGSTSIPGMMTKPIINLDLYQPVQDTTLD